MHNRFLTAPWLFLALHKKIVEFFSLRPHHRGVDKSQASSPLSRYCFHPLPLRLTCKNPAFLTVDFFLLINHLALFLSGFNRSCVGLLDCTLWFRCFTAKSWFNFRNTLSTGKML
jgi:hypothetical protein